MAEAQIFDKNEQKECAIPSVYRRAASRRAV
jgi:hypothetical protein